jgi:hypothetical protein
MQSRPASPLYLMLVLPSAASRLQQSNCRTLLQATRRYGTSLMAENLYLSDATEPETPTLGKVPMPRYLIQMKEGTAVGQLGQVAPHFN